MIQQLAFPYGGQQCHYEREDAGQNHPVDNQENGGGNMSPDYIQHRHLVDDGLAHVALQQVAEEIEVLNEERLVEAEFLFYGLDGGIGCFRSQQDIGRVAGQKVHQKKSDDADPYQNRYEFEGTQQNESKSVHSLCTMSC